MSNTNFNLIVVRNLDTTIWNIELRKAKLKRRLVIWKIRAKKKGLHYYHIKIMIKDKIILVS